MSPVDSTRPAASRVLGYRFAGVVLDLNRHALTVDDAEVPATPQMLQLLQLLCEADGRLLKRQEVFDRLWPGGQEVSDASLSQLVWRLRGALGPYAESVATVRRSGLRLDAPVTTEFDFQRTPRRPNVVEPPAVQPPLRDVDLMQAQPPPLPPAPPPKRRSWRLRYGLPGAVIVVVLAIVVMLLPRNTVVSAGYALYADDLQASRADTPALIATAISADNAGERVRAEALLRSVHDADATTPVPALILSWWSSFSSPIEAERWTQAARQRLGADATPYLRLFADYFTARALDRPTSGPLNALLDLRPQAWFLQYSRAHSQLANRELAGALRSLQQIPLDIPDARQLAEVLGDRVALGDAAAADEALRAKAIAADPVLSAYLQGRIAYSRGDLPAAIAAFDRSAGVAEEHRVYEYRLRASNFAVLAALDAGAADAAARIDAAVRLAREQDRADIAAELRGFEAFLAARAGQPERAETALADARQGNSSEWFRVPLTLLALENGLAPPYDPAALAPGVPAIPVYGGVAEIVLGWHAFARGDKAEAGRQLDLARERGIARTYHAEDAALLAARLGRKAVPCRLDPPYPNSLRLTACIALRGEKP
ncbi:winged helix-turn-helix domain-containing protein [Tahibacter soli]|uniref:Winged helix-turn-helix domain-containing protein n=1 Tax=Tahibacter soli TaxID=2983605 RepID=A0A9X3YH16_9GAMM|nr:winged helix-turn-helix domain-containing protein [Tahibacter soli]MDC8011005.1 winged helix-turn-helix domain-containing protein [Tahibacter soli]